MIQKYLGIIFFTALCSFTAVQAITIKKIANYSDQPFSILYEPFLVIQGVAKFSQPYWIPLRGPAQKMTVQPGVAMNNVALNIWPGSQLTLVAGNNLDKPLRISYNNYDELALIGDEEVNAFIHRESTHNLSPMPLKLVY